MEPEQKLKVFLVGGAVRDSILGNPVKDRDWVVVGATPQQMLDQGFIPIGKDFPVFLHPKTKEEYALARTERKTGKGYRGFKVISDPKITLEQDLRRRDLTMNAIARDPDGNLIDPFGGERDLKQGVIRHVSDAFREDPVRILRAAKFAARYQGNGFQIHPDTRKLMQYMVAQGEADALVAERVWAELEAVLIQGNVARFIEELARCHALARVLPEVNALFGVPQVEKYHPEVDTGIHTLMALKALEQLGGDPLLRFAVLLHDLGKARTPPSEYPSHRAHEYRGIRPINQLCDRLRVPKRYRLLALKVCELHLHCHRLFELRPGTIVKMLEKMDAFRQPEVVDQFALCCEADKRGRAGFETRPYPQRVHLLHLYQKLTEIDARKIAQQCKDKSKIKEALTKARIRVISEQQVTGSGYHPNT